MKRLAQLLAVLLMVLAVLPLAAEGQKESSDSQEIVELIWYLPGGSGFPYDSEAEKEIYSKLNAMLERDLGIRVDIRATGGFGEYKETMPLTMAAGEKYDIVWTSHWCNDFMDAAGDGYYAGLDELLPEYAPTIWKDTKDALESTRVDGEIRGVWNQQIAAKTSNVLALESLIEEFGWDLSEIKEAKDLEPLLEQVKQEKPDMIPFSMRKPLAEYMTPDLGYAEVGILTELLAVRMDDESCTVFNLLEDPGFLDYIELAREWNRKGYVPKDGLTYNNDQWNQMVNSGRVALRCHNTWIPGKERVPTGFGDAWIQQPFEGPSVMQGGNITSTINAINSRSEYKKEAVQLLEYLWTHPEAYNLLVWGVEGEHYNMEGAFMTPLQESGYYTNIPWVFGNTFISHIRQGENPEANEKIYQLNQKAEKSPLMGFALDMDPIKTEVAMVSSVKEQYHKSVVGGYVGDGEYDAYLSALKQAGIDQLLDEIQKQIDAWLAAK